MSDNTDILKKLCEPFSASEIGKLPKPTKAQTDEVKRDFTKGVRCSLCGGWHHPKVVHLDYVGHAALTARFLKVDPHWFWEPMAFGDDGLPCLDKDGGLWIRLTVGGMSRIGYGSAQAKNDAGDTMKERIGDALRNAGIRFGCALDLWHKGDLEVMISDINAESSCADEQELTKNGISNDRLSKAIQSIKDGTYTKEKLIEKFDLTSEQLLMLGENDAD